MVWVQARDGAIAGLSARFAIRKRSARASPKLVSGKASAAPKIESWMGLR
jgi:hypothetical protein